jgi:hypothetical protein
MALVIEDGTLVANADSWVTRADYITYAAARGITITDDATADVQLLKAGEFINQHEDNLKGDLVDRDQSMSFPRYNLTIDGWWWTGEEIPRQVILCQLAYALDINAGVDIYNPPQNPNLATKKEKVDVIEVEYAVSENTGQKLSRTSTGDALLHALLENSGLNSISLVRA